MGNVSGVVFRDRFIQQGNTRLTVVAIDPSPSCWESNFPSGAAGVLLKDGRIVVGDGNCLSHSDILHHAWISDDDELYRLQIFNGAAFAEVWLDGDLFDDDDVSVEDVHAAVMQEYGETIDRIAERVAVAVRRFWPEAVVRAIPVSNFDQQPYLQEDREWVAQVRSGELQEKSRQPKI
jgi:hypothetical protein